MKRILFLTAVFIIANYSIAANRDKETNNADSRPDMNSNTEESSSSH